jgi:hypothetical protein
MTPPGIEPAAFRFVAQYLNPCATISGPLDIYIVVLKNKEDKLYTHKVTLRLVRVTIVTVEKQPPLHILNVCVCSISYPACNAHAPYCRIWPARLYNFFLFTFCHKSHVFRKTNY